MLGLILFYLYFEEFIRFLSIIKMKLYKIRDQVLKIWKSLPLQRI